MCVHWNVKLIEALTFKESPQLRIEPTHSPQMQKWIWHPEPFSHLYSHPRKLKVHISTTVLQDFVRPPSIYFHVDGDHVSSWKILFMRSMCVAVSALEVNQLFHNSTSTGRFAHFFHHATHNTSLLQLQQCFCFVLLLISSQTLCACYAYSLQFLPTIITAVLAGAFSLKCEWQQVSSNF